MKRRLVILFLLGGSIAACKIHRLPALPAERDPTAEQGAVVPYRPPPDVLTTELSTGSAETGSGHEGHEGHDMSGKAAPKTGHEGHDMGGPSESGKPTPKKTGHEGHDMGGSGKPAPKETGHEGHDMGGAEKPQDRGAP